MLNNAHENLWRMKTYVTDDPRRYKIRLWYRETQNAQFPNRRDHRFPKNIVLIQFSEKEEAKKK